MEFNQINSDILAASGEVECFAKLRYRQKEVPCIAKVVDGEIELTFKHSQSQLDRRPFYISEKNALAVVL